MRAAGRGPAARRARRHLALRPIPPARGLAADAGRDWRGLAHVAHKSDVVRLLVLLREGGSIPIVEHFARILKVDTYLLGLALPDDNLHSPNEKIDLEAFTRGIWMSANLWTNLANA